MHFRGSTNRQRKLHQRHANFGKRKQRFGGQTVSGGSGADVALLKSPVSATTTVTMPARAATITANYITVSRLAVNGGTGAGHSLQSKQCSQITTPSSGQRFSDVGKQSIAQKREPQSQMHRSQRSSGAGSKLASVNRRLKPCGHARARIAPPAAT